MEKVQLETTEQLLSQAKQSLLFTANRPELVIERGKGMYVWDTNQKKYLDFVGGWAVTCLGHAPDVITEALCHQSAILVNASPAYYNKPMIEFSKLLTEVTCFDRVFFASTGAEANESAIKLARKYGSKELDGAYEIITLQNSFHGRSLATMSATGKTLWKDLFSPKVPGFKHVPINDLEQLRSSINNKTCGIMLELIQGEGGVHAVNLEYVKALRAICDEKGILLIFDEIQTGIARTGKLFAYQHYGIEPDIMTLGKGIGGGFPLSAMLTKEKFNIFDPGDQGGTYSGQPLAMSVGLAVVSKVIELNLAEHAEQLGNYLMTRLEELAGSYPIMNIRGRGLLVAFDLPEPVGMELLTQCLDQGLLINCPSPNTIRLMPALIVSKEDIDHMLSILSSALGKVLL